MTARQAIGSWCLGMLAAGIVLGVMFERAMRQPCTYQSETTYTAQGKPLCVIVKPIKETP